ncbi:Rmf/CrpP family protein [Streptomyces platensis]|uniref:Rmf/CrpP family protein n=1 Tax=Streptomyces platensis TaxID=58346 RepID=UPI003C2B6F1E
MTPSGCGSSRCFRSGRRSGAVGGGTVCPYPHASTLRTAWIRGHVETRPVAAQPESTDQGMFHGRRRRTRRRKIGLLVRGGWHLGRIRIRAWRSPRPCRAPTPPNSGFMATSGSARTYATSPHAFGSSTAEAWPKTDRASDRSFVPSENY